MSFSEEKAAKMVERLSEGRSLRYACRKGNPDGLPHWRTVLRWQVEHPDFASKCARAREAGAESDLEEMRMIERKVLRGELKSDAANVVLSNKRWRMEKLKSRAFGQRLELEHSGSIQTIPDEELEKRLRELAGRLTDA